MKTHTVGDVMTDDVVQAHRRTPFEDLVELLDRHRIGGLPVVDADDKVVGVVSATDLARGRAGSRQVRHEQGGAPGSGLRSATLSGALAEELMSSPAITVHPEQLVPEAARLMDRHHVERLPVVDEEDRLIGIATHRDLLRVFLRTDGQIRRQVIDEILVGALGLPADAVTVSVRDGVVVLKGCLERRGDIPLAVRAAWRVEGVIGVVNALGHRADD
ncbi:CBS domain-containing protein [Streptomyces scabiei]|uniref:CBS domain-containing protein n=1 Tax=Streptomyces scabiei TaxID=1930 RepID=UPI0038F60A5C